MKWLAFQHPSAQARACANKAAAGRISGHLCEPTISSRRSVLLAGASWLAMIHLNAAWAVRSEDCVDPRLKLEQIVPELPHFVDGQVEQGVRDVVSRV